jgi:hypothetical protein
MSVRRLAFGAPLPQEVAMIAITAAMAAKVIFFISIIIKLFDL